MGGINIKKTLKKRFTSIMLASTLVMGGTIVAHAASFGNSLNGASSTEVLQVKYNGAAWNYSGSGYRNASFKYTRNGKTLLSKVATNGKVTGSVWDDLIHWGDKYTTKFSWNRQK